MASSGTFTSGRYGGGSSGPWLTLAWTQVSQSVANNTTTLDLTLRFHWNASGGIGYTFHNRSGSLQGHSYTYSGSVSGTSGSRILRTQRVTIEHNSNGSRSVTLSGNITSLGLRWSSVNIGTMSVSGTANLNTIPRASTLSKFSFGANLKNGTANEIRYTVDRKSTAFRHHIQLRDGSHVLRTWDNISSNGDSTLTLTDSEVNTLLNRMSSTTTKSLTLRVRTRSGNNGSWIGSAVSRNNTVTVHSDVKPSVGSVSLSQTGNPVTTHTLQGFSKIKASFAREGGYGAWITSSSIQVRRRSGGADSQTINSNNGTTPNPVSSHGVYEARGTTRDSRGRTTHTSWATITVTQYRAPTITNFSAVRNSSTPTTVNISRATTHTRLGGNNKMTYAVQRRQGAGAWTNVNTSATGEISLSPSSSTSTSTGNSVMQSYSFRYVVTDNFGGRAEASVSVSTQRVVLDIHKNEGVGIGKIHEHGVLDVDGGANFTESLHIHDSDSGNGSIYFNPNPTGTTEGRGVYFRDYSPNFTGPISFRLAHIAPGGKSETLYMGELGNWDNALVIQKNGRSPQIGNNQIVNSGSNSNGDWIRFYDGTQLCRRTFNLNNITSLGFGNIDNPYRTNGSTWTLPQSFDSVNAYSYGATVDYDGFAGAGRAIVVTGRRLSGSQIEFQAFRTTSNSTSGNVNINVYALGRWK